MEWADTTKKEANIMKASNSFGFSQHDFDDKHMSYETKQLKSSSSKEAKSCVTGATVTLLNATTSSSSLTSLPGVFSRWNLVQQILLNSVNTNIKMNDASVGSLFAKYTVDLRKTSHEQRDTGSRVHWGVPVVRAQVRLQSPGVEASLFFYLLLDTGEGDLKYLTETQLWLGHGPLDAHDQRDFSSENFAHLKSDQYFSLEVGLEPLRFRYQPATQKLVLLVGRRDDANFLVPHPATSGQEAHAVEIRHVSIILPTLAEGGGDCNKY